MREAALCIRTFWSFNGPIPVVILSDDPGIEYLKTHLHNPTALILSRVQFDVPENPEHHCPRVIGNKPLVVERAIDKFGETLFVDSDIVFLRESPVPRAGVPLVLSPHYDDAFPIPTNTMGLFNAGYLFASDRRVASVWGRYAADPMFPLEQKALEMAALRIPFLTFDQTHNWGPWRAYPTTPHCARSIHVHTDLDRLVTFPDDTLRDRSRYLRAWALNQLRLRCPEVVSWFEELPPCNRV